MLNIQKIIVPVDFHTHTSDLAEFAIGIANKLEAKITFIHAIEYALSYLDFSPESFKELNENLNANAEEKMKALVAKSKGACPECEGVVLTGDVADAIVSYASDNAIDMIIIGTHGAQGIEKILLGSVAERVVKRASCPTLVFNPYKGERGYKITPSIQETVLPV
jgi:nucleotide-binding universal stress UspA family protein